MLDSIFQAAIGAAFVGLGWAIRTVLAGKQKLENSTHQALVAKAETMDRELEDVIKKEIQEAIEKMERTFLELETALELHRNENARDAAKINRLEIHHESMAERMAGFETRLAQEFSATRDSFDKLRSDVIAALARSGRRKGGGL